MRAFLLLLALLPAAARGETLADTHFGFNFCYAHAFDAVHLREHPEQQVRTIRLGRERIGTMRAPGILPVELRVTLREDGGEFRGQAECRPDGDGLLCRMGLGEGGFALEADGAGIRLVVSPGGMALSDWSREEVRLEADEGEDREFLLRNCG